MDFNQFSSFFDTCTCRCTMPASWGETGKDYAYQPGSDEVFDSASQCAPLQSDEISRTSLEPFFSTDVEFSPDFSLECDANLASEAPESYNNQGSDASAEQWTKKLDELERAISCLQNASSDQSAFPVSRLDDLEGSVNAARAEIGKLQGAITGLERWAQSMNRTYLEFKNTICEVVKLLNSP
jgi:TPR repeat protein